MRMCLNVNSMSPSSWLAGTLSDEIPGLERLEDRVHVLESADHPQHLSPERLADHRGIQEAAANLWRKGIDPGGDGRSDRGGQFGIAQALGKRARQLFEEQRIPFRYLHDAFDGRGEDLYPERM